VARFLGRTEIMMFRLFRRHRPPAVSLAMVALVLSVQCAPGEPRTEAERSARGRELIDRMSRKLASASTFTVRTSERSERIRPGGRIQPVALTRETSVRRPDRIHFKTAGDMQVEAWYDGIGLTIAMHNEKVFGQAPMPETIDGVLDTLHERYGMATPLGDFLYSSAARALVAETTTGGWIGRETIDGQQTDHLAFKDKGVSWEIWLASGGDQLPRKFRADFTGDRRLRKVDVTFSDWNLKAVVAAELFKPSVPGDYEGIAIVQRARALRNLPSGLTPAGTVKK
jgi:hypothetical protein